MTAYELREAIVKYLAAYGLDGSTLVKASGLVQVSLPMGSIFFRKSVDSPNFGGAYGTGWILDSTSGSTQVLREHATKLLKEIQ